MAAFLEKAEICENYYWNNPQHHVIIWINWGSVGKKKDTGVLDD